MLDPRSPVDVQSRCRAGKNLGRVPHRAASLGAWRSPLAVLLGLGIASLSLASSPASGADALENQTTAGLVVTPASIELTDPFARRQLRVVLDGQDQTRAATYQTAASTIVSVDSRGYVVPLANGQTEIVVSCGGQTARVPVVTQNLDQVRPVDFSTEVEPLLSRFGCNAGGCHGKASGQNGFRLSLFGFDADFDYRALVLEGRGRRISTTAPESSLLILKAIGAVPHGGGKRIEPDSEPYRLLVSWMRAGAPPATPDAPRVTRLVVEPAEQSLAADAGTQLTTFAHYSDGSTRDVTREAQYGTNIDVVARVDEDGYVTAGAQTGEAAVMARYMGQVSVCRVLRPHGPALAKLEDFTPRGFIDELSANKWMKLGLVPSEPCSDAVFLRRVTIDLAGRLPTVSESREFLADMRHDRRERLVERLLASPDYPAYFALKWGSILRNSSLAGSERVSYAFHNWIKDQIARNVPYDQFVRGIVAASGEWPDAPAVNWFWQSRDDQLHMVTADTAQVFLGLRLQCAKCHHHPYERFSQDDYYGLAGFFTRLGRKNFGEPPPYFSSPTVTIGEVHPVTGQRIEPKYLDGAVAVFSPEEDPRHALVDWMSRPENPFFAKALVNRLWGHFFGRGLVQEIDDLRETNPASNPELLDRLAEEFRSHQFDVRHIIRLIVNSGAYQLSSQPRDENRSDLQNFARFYARRLPAEVLHDAVDQACGTRTPFSNMSAQARAVDLPNERFGSYFLDAFDRPKRVSACECERSTSATLSQVLLLANSSEIEDRIRREEGRLNVALKAGRSSPQIIEELYLAALSRYPTPAEIIVAEKHLARDTDQRRGLEDLLWSLLNTREFAFNH